MVRAKEGECDLAGLTWQHHGSAGNCAHAPPRLLRGIRVAGARSARRNGRSSGTPGAPTRSPHIAPVMLPSSSWNQTGWPVAVRSCTDSQAGLCARFRSVKSAQVVANVNRSEASAGYAVAGGTLNLRPHRRQRHPNHPDRAAKHTRKKCGGEHVAVTETCLWPTSGLVSERAPEWTVGDLDWFGSAQEDGRSREGGGGAD